jgi:glucose-1-phosphate cytidylyltransferase
MKVVLFCGGLGMRIREHPEPVPKPMISIGYRPILWHVMKYYAHFGHRDFILCLGYRADAIKSYFLQYNECVSNDFVFAEGGRTLRLLNSDIHDWNITFVDTGIASNIGQRLKAVQPFLADEEMFLANYSDAVTDLPLPDLITRFRECGKVGCFVAVRPPYSYHVIESSGDVVTRICPIRSSGIWINGGFFAFRQDIFEYLREGEELVEQPFQRLIREEQLLAYRYEGYWACMDTFKDKEQLESLHARDEAPWELWKPVGTRRRLPGPQC